jgi:hypothetical protein
MSPGRRNASAAVRPGRSASAPLAISVNRRSQPARVRASRCRSRLCSDVETRAYLTSTRRHPSAPFRSVPPRRRAFHNPCQQASFGTQILGCVSVPSHGLAAAVAEQPAAVCLKRAFSVLPPQLSQPGRFPHFFMVSFLDSLASGGSISVANAVRARSSVLLRRCAGWEVPYPYRLSPLCKAIARQRAVADSALHAPE